jgi:hypothetical protein
MNARLRTLGPPILVVLAALIVYANALANGFALDDNFIVQTNTRVHDLANVRAIWLTPYWPFFGTELGLYRPLAIFGYAIQWAIAGNTPWLFHAGNLVLHASVSLLAFLLLRRLAGTMPALIGALVFALHPVHTEAVANVVGQAELIAGATTLGACLMHVTRPAGPDIGWGRRLALALLFVAGVLAKESAIVLPALLMMLDVFQGRVRIERSSMTRYLRGMAMPMFLVAAGAVFYFSVRVGVLGSIGGVDAAPNLPFLRQQHRVLVAFRAWVEYIRLLAFPMDLSVDYSPGVVLPVEGVTPMVALGAVIFVALAIIAVLTPRYREPGLAASWLLITALPASNLLIPIGVVAAERLLYTPSFALSLAIAFAWQHAIAPHPARFRSAMAVAVVVLLLFGARTWIRNPDWKSTDTVWHSLVRDHPESYRAQWNNASFAFRAGHQELGYGFMELAHGIWPHDSQLLNEMGFVLIGMSQFDSAAVFLERSREITAWVPRTHALLAQAYIGAGRFGDAAVSARDALHYGAPRDGVFPLLAQAHEGDGDLPRAIGAWRVTLNGPLRAFWMYWGRLARALARYGLEHGALAAVDSAAHYAAPADSAAHLIIGQVRDGITRGCYAPGAPAREDCEDPFAGWKLLAPIQTVETARRSQNATVGSGTVSR